MSYTVSLTEDQIMGGLGDFIASVLPSGIQIVQGQDNGVPLPTSGDFVVMTPARREQLSQTAHSYDPVAGTLAISRSTSLHFQLDVYGPNASDNAQVITTLFRDDFGFQFFKPRGLAPLYCDDGQQMPLVSAEKQYIARWMMRGVLQTNLAISTPAEFADTIVITSQEVA